MNKKVFDFRRKGFVPLRRIFHFFEKLLPHQKIVVLLH